MSKGTDRLALLATFARIAERGSISAAARDLSLAQASASRRLAELERRLGVRLVERSTHELALTEAGRDCLIQARSLLDEWDALEQRHAEGWGEPRGKLKVIAPVALGQLHLARAALSFRLRHPGVALTWLLDDEPVRFPEVGCDLWVKVGPVPDEGLVVRPIGTVERLAVASPALLTNGPPATPEGLAGLPCAALGPFEGGRVPMSGPEGRTVVTAKVVFLTDNLFVAREAALAGVGFAVMPRWLVQRDLDTGALVEALPNWRAPRLTVHAATLPAQRQPLRLRLFARAIAEAVAAIPGVETC